MFASLMMLFSRKSEPRKFVLLNLGDKTIEARITDETEDEIKVKYTRCRRNALVSYWSTCQRWIERNDPRIVRIYEKKRGRKFSLASNEKKNFPISKIKKMLRKFSFVKKANQKPFDYAQGF